MNAAHVHLVLNHAPLFGLITGIVLAALLVVAFLAVGVVGYAANLGGQIRHPEITARQ